MHKNIRLSETEQQMKRFYAIPGSIAIIVAACGFFSRPSGTAGNAGSEDLQLGNRAFASGDYTAAERYYRKAVVLLNSPLREQGMLKLCRVLLKRNDPAGAYNLLKELEERSPGFYTGVVPGMIQAAEGNLDEAAKSFRKIANSGGSDRFEASHHLGAVCLEARRYPEALEAFSELEKSPVPAEKKSGLYGRVLTLIRQGRNKDAAEVIKKADKDITIKKLSLLNLVSSGDLDAFRTAWKNEDALKKDPRPDNLLYNICRTAADLAASGKDEEFAAVCLQDAFDFASGDAERKDIMHQLFNMQSRRDPSAAVETVKRYRKAFPDAPDKALLQIQGGRLLAANGRYQEAFELFSNVVKDEENLLDERRSAAGDAAAAAEKGGMYPQAQKMYEYLAARSMTPAQKQRSELRLGEFFMRRKNYASAEKHLKNVILQNGESAENARARLLQLQVETGNRTLAKETAALLLGAVNKRFADYGRYQLARLTEQEGDLADARKLYQEFLRSAPQSRHASAVSFAIAVLSEKLGNLREASAEYLDFATRYPQDANAAAALFFALRADCMNGGDVTAVKCLELLKKNHQSSPEYGVAGLQLAGFYFESGSPEKALALLKQPDDASPHAPSVLLLRARIRFAGSRPAEALQDVNVLLEKYPTCREAAEANLLGGNILADLGERKSALEYFLRAEKLQPGGLFGEIVSGRIADCSRELYSGSDFDSKLLDDAVKRYLHLAENSANPAIRLQSMYKAGACYGLAGKHDRAAELYEKTLYYASLLKSGGVEPDPVWCARAAYAGARAALKKVRPAKLARALRMLRLYEELSLPSSGEDFDTLRTELRNSYNLLRRKEQK